MKMKNSVNFKENEKGIAGQARNDNPFRMKAKFFALLSMIVLLTACGGGDDNSKAEQSITFGALPPHDLSEGTFELSATASSGLQVSFRSSDLTVATVSGTRVTLLKKGSTTITASQSGNNAFNEATDVSRLLTVNETVVTKEAQTINFVLSVNEWSSTTENLALEATATSGLPVTFTLTTDHPNAQIEGNALKLTYTGAHYDTDVVITASQAGNDTYNPAPNVARTVHIKHE
jgi:hypothetical protein